MPDATQHRKENAAEILEEARRRGLLDKAISGPEATAFVRWLLPALHAWTPTRGANTYERGNERIKLTPRTLTFLRKTQDGWRKRSSMPLIAAVTAFLVEAAELVEPELATKMAGRVTRDRLAAEESSARQSKRRQTKKEEEWAWGESLKVLEAEAESARGVLRAALRYPSAIKQLGAERQLVAARLTHDEEQRDDWAISIDAPPLAPFLEPLTYSWVQDDGPAAVPIQLRSMRPGVVSVAISPNKSLMLNTQSLAVEMFTPFWDPDEVSADLGTLSGRIHNLEGDLVAELVLLIPRDMAGARRLTDLWCRLLAGYGISTFVMRGVTPEDRQTIAALMEAGVVWATGDKVFRVVCEPRSTTRRLFTNGRMAGRRG